MKISKRGTFIAASPIRRLIPIANAAEERGIKVYHLNIGQPDIPTPIPAIPTACFLREVLMNRLVIQLSEPI